MLRCHAYAALGFQAFISLQAGQVGAFHSLRLGQITRRFGEASQATGFVAKRLARA